MLGSLDRNLEYWDLNTGQCLLRMAGYHDDIRAVALSGDDRLRCSASFDQTLKVWDLERGTLLATFTTDEQLILLAKPHPTLRRQDRRWL